MDGLLRGIMNASLVERIPADEQVQSLLIAVRELQREVRELRRENAELRRQVSELQCDVGYWKSMHARGAAQHKAASRIRSVQGRDSPTQIRTLRQAIRKTNIDRSLQ